jgi:CDP-glucose 4,6-dehydratase
MLHWHPVWNVENAIEETITWYKNYYTKNGQVDSLSNLKKYVESAKSQGIVWA